MLGIYSYIKFRWKSISWEMLWTSTQNMDDVWGKEFPLWDKSKMQLCTDQKQPPRGVLKKRCSEKMQQIYMRTPMQKCDFNEVALQLYWNLTSALVFSCKFAAYFQSTFFYGHPWVVASELSKFFLMYW